MEQHSWQKDLLQDLFVERTHFILLYMKFDFKIPVIFIHKHVFVDFVFRSFI